MLRRTELLVVFAVVALIAGLASSCSEQATPPDSKKGFERRIRARSSGLFGAFHGNERISLIIDGKEFPQVIGLPPYYLKIPDTNVIFFQTAETSSGTYHVYFLDTRTDIAVRADTTNPGHAIGLSGVDHNKVWVESFSSNVLVLGNRFLRVQGHHYIDLEQRKVLKEEVWIYDQEHGGRITNHVTYQPPIGY